MVPAKISLVMPCYNGEKFIEEAVLSVIQQGYPNLEFIVVDGGSTDRTLQILGRYSSYIHKIISEKDEGQADAILKGLNHCTGEWFNWLNCDDLLEAGALDAIAAVPSDYDVAIGRCLNFDESGPVCEFVPRKLTSRILVRSAGLFHQPSTWVRREKLQQFSPLDKSLNYAFDWEMMIRYLYENRRVRVLERRLARFRLHNQSKSCTMQSAFAREFDFVLRKLLRDPRMSRIHGVVDVTLRRSVWYLTLCRLQEEYRERALIGIARGAALMFVDPLARMGRHSGYWGFVRRILRKEAPGE
jgi:glycosyltransferase involved in cell wall biosynthesis